ncbi:MAG: flagellar basal body rod protein FlgB [Myxococcota bacterium]
MPLIDDPVSRLMEQVLGFANLRQDVIASNLANANTPGYRAFDLVLQESLGSGPSLEPARSDPRHLSLGGSDGLPSGAELKPSNAPARLDGNNVNLDQELMKMLENRFLYQAAMELRDRWGNLKPVARDLR